MANECYHQAQTLLVECPLIDGHNDFAYILRGWCGSELTLDRLDCNALPIGQTDIQRLRKGKVGGQFWSAFVPDSGATSAEMLLATLQQIDLIHTLISQFPQDLGYAESAADVVHIFNSGRIACLLGIEGLHQTGGSVSALRQLYRLGARYATLCHNNHNEFAESATGSTLASDALSARGRSVVLEMNRIGMYVATYPGVCELQNPCPGSHVVRIVDLSHTSHRCQRAVLELSKAPVIFSHSACHTLMPHCRNVQDDILDLLQRNGGVIMICFLPDLCGQALPSDDCPDHSNPSIATVVSHIVYVGSRIGYCHVGIGSDFDGMLAGPVDLDDVGKFPNLVQEMIRQGLKQDDIRSVMGGNILRVLRAVEEHARGEGKASKTSHACDQIHPVWTEAQRQMLISKGKERGLGGV